MKVFRYILFFLCSCLFCLYGAENQLESGKNVTVSDFTQCKKISDGLIPQILELENVAFSEEELRNFNIPGGWWIDWSTVTPKTQFSNAEDGFSVKSSDSPLKMFSAWHSIMANQVRIRVKITNCSTDADAKVAMGYSDRTLIHYGEKVLQEFTLPAGETSEFSCDYSCKDGVAECRNLLRVQGNVVIHSFTMEMTPVPGIICIEGTVLNRSKLPDPAKSDYPNCCFTIHFEGNAILSGEKCNREIVLTIEGFHDYKKQRSQQILPGMHILCCIVPFESLPEKEQEIQVADNLNLFELDNYYVYSALYEKDFTSVPTLFSDGIKEYTSFFDRHINPPVSEEIVKEQQSQIKTDLEKMQTLLKDYPDMSKLYNSVFKIVLQTELMNNKNGRNRLSRGDLNYIWKKVDDSYWIFPVDWQPIPHYTPISKENMDALLAFKKGLEANGVQLIVSVVPNAYDIAPRVALEDFRKVPDTQSANLVKQLADAGIEAIYGSDAVISNYNRYPFAYLFPFDAHPSDTVQDVMTELMAKRLERYQIPKTLEADKFTMQQGRHVYADRQECLIPENCDTGDFKPGTSYPCQCVYYDGKELSPDSKSSVLVIGNSFVQSPRGKPESYASHLARHSLINPDCYLVQSNGPLTTMVERIFKQPEKYLKGKKVLILHMGCAHFTQKVLWRNLEQMDKYQLAMNGKHEAKGVVPAGEQGNSEFFADLPEKHVFVCAKDEEKTIAAIDCADLDASKPLVCLIPASAEEAKVIQLHCNGQSVTVPQYLSYANSWNNLIFELPAGTKEISVSVSGPDGAHIAIRKVIVLQ